MYKKNMLCKIFWNRVFFFLARANFSVAKHVIIQHHFFRWMVDAIMDNWSIRWYQGYRNFEIQIGPLDRWRHRRHTNMSSTIINSRENSSFSSKSVSEIDYFSDTVQLQPVVSKRSRDNPKSLA